MELRNLKTFQIAADLLNFTKTAKVLNFTQPTVTSQIRALETELNHPLFFRIGQTNFFNLAR
ncbi:LysR family transcriptional regulator [Terrilactibacillus sp. S3-3]|nr:LysR family transcriptional regulator [Terrilactibacillus sp. S3-3]